MTKSEKEIRSCATVYVEIMKETLTALSTIENPKLRAALITNATTSTRDFEKDLARKTAKKKPGRQTTIEDEA